ncbi:MAG: sigma-70 family RNA polymerase sigma factor [Planctomycetota bacterium]
MRQAEFMQTDDSTQLVDHFCRHEFARLIAALARKFGVRHMELVEDAVQGAFLRALRSWPLKGIPPQPGPWLYRVAYNLAMDHLRRDLRWNSVASAGSVEDPSFQIEHPPYCEDEITDSQLRMIFACCCDEIPRESQVALALKTLCGFGNEEIARALLISEANVAKRLVRAKQRLRSLKFDPNALSVQDFQARLPMVQAVAYLLFNEGYSSTNDDRLIREELCEEAVRLALLLAEHPWTQGPRSSALLALMLFHASRLETRLDESGRMLQLADQDRSLWDHRMIAEAGRWILRACDGEPTRYHVEAWIASEHCTAKSADDTHWDRIVQAYDLLLKFDDSPVVQLNRAIAIAEYSGVAAGWQALNAIEHQFRDRYHLWTAAAGEFAYREGKLSEARRYYERALSLTSSATEQTFLRAQIAKLDTPELDPAKPAQ